jgi:hypothetical protein
MTTLPTVSLDHNPAVLDATWLPNDSPFDELTDLAVAHVALLEELNEQARQRAALRGKFSHEDELREAQVVQAHRRGMDEPPDRRTPQHKRDEQMQRLVDQTRMKMHVLEDLVARIVSVIQNHENEWVQSMLEEEHGTRQRVLDLRAELAEAERLAAETPKLRMWIERTAKNQPGRHLQWRYLANPPTTDLLKIANEGRSRANSIPSQHMSQDLARTGGTVVDDHDPKPEDYADETVDYSSHTYLSQLDEALRDHATKRLAGESAPGAL